MITKTCFNSECPADNPQPLDNFHKQSTGKLGVRSRCRTCHNKDMRERHTPEASRRKTLRQYGMTLEDYDRMLQDQEDKCAICKGTEGGHPATDLFVVDHCHITGEVRGLLCARCNMVLGMFLDSPALLKSAITYLENA